MCRSVSPWPERAQFNPTHSHRKLLETTMNSKLSLRSMLLATAAAAAFSLSAGAAQAATVAGLMDGGAMLVWIDTGSMKVTKSVKVQGASLVGIDVRPADKQLYGLTTQGKIVTIDAATGKITEKSQVSEKLPEGGAISVDFNPAADRLRIIGADGTSLRVNVEDGKAVVDGSLKYADADANKGKTPKAIAVAYTNSVAGP
jgi:DNA-binding beta-propeller fold protein YncE